MWITCASSSGFRDCLHTITTLCQISFGLKRLMRRACLVRRASLRTLGNMFQTMALTRRSSSSQMNRKMSLKVESSENVKWRDVIWVFSSFFEDWFQTMALTHNSSLLQMNRKMSLDVKIICQMEASTLSYLSFYKFFACPFCVKTIDLSFHEFFFRLVPDDGFDAQQLFVANEP